MSNLHHREALQNRKTSKCQYLDVGSSHKNNVTAQKPKAKLKESNWPTRKQGSNVEMTKICSKKP